MELKDGTKIQATVNGVPVEGQYINRSGAGDTILIQHSGQWRVDAGSIEILDA